MNNTPFDKCPYSQGGTCKACEVMEIKCDGSKYNLCAQYEEKELEQKDGYNG